MSPLRYLLLLGYLGLFGIGCNNTGDGLDETPQGSPKPVKPPAGGNSPGSGAAADASVASAEEFEPPLNSAGAVDDEARGRGDSSLVVTLTDETDGKSAAAYIRLWRIDVPGDDAWQRGDHV